MNLREWVKAVMENQELVGAIIRRNIAKAVGLELFSNPVKDESILAVYRVTYKKNTDALKRAFQKSVDFEADKFIKENK